MNFSSFLKSRKTVPFLGISIAFSVMISVIVMPTQALATASPTLKYPASSYTYMVGTPIIPVNPTITNGPIKITSITPAIPKGIYLNMTTGVFYATPNAVIPKTTFTLKGSGKSGSFSTSISLTVLAAVPSLTYTYNLTFMEQVSKIAIPTLKNGPIKIISITPALPAGVTLNTSTGAITAIPTASKAATTYTIKGTDPYGTFTSPVKLTVLPWTASLTYPSNAPTYTVGKAITPDTPKTANGFTGITNTIVLPSGLTLNKKTGEISGTPTVAKSRATYLLQGENTYGAFSYDLSIAIIDSETLAYPLAKATYTQETPITNNVPVIQNGPIQITTVTPPLPAGLEINVETGVISGRPVKESGQTTYTLKGINNTGLFQTTISLGVDAMKPAGTVYYVANNGNDKNTGTSESSAWQTITKINEEAAAGKFQPGDQILLERGGVWRDAGIECLNNVTATASTTLSNTKPNCSGTAGQPITFGAYGSASAANPLIDGADPLTLKWTLVSGETYSAPTSVLPLNLYVDSQTAQTKALLPVPNNAGTYVSTKAYKFLDQVNQTIVTANGTTIYHSICFATTGCPAGTSLGNKIYYVDVANATAGNFTQSFSLTNTALQNLEAIAGSWYVGSGKIYVHLADGSNPTKHIFEGAIRAHGVELSSVNYVAVKDLSIERVTRSGIFAHVYADPTLAGSYRTNEYITIDSNKIWNTGSNNFEILSQQGEALRTVQNGAITIFPMFKPVPPQQRGWNVTNNTIGTVDVYYALRSQDDMGIYMSNVTDGHIQFNTVAAVNTAAILYGNLSADNNVGGDVGNNTITQSQGNIFFGAIKGGRLHDNLIHDSAAEGIQLGGATPGSGGCMIDHNIIYNLDKGGSTVGYNGIDCNGVSKGLMVKNNTIWNTNSANITMENISSGGKPEYVDGQLVGCVGMIAENNLFSQAGVTEGMVNYDPVAKGDFSYTLYVAGYLRTAKGWSYDHNMWAADDNAKPYYSAMNCAQWLTFAPDTNSSCKDPEFVDQAKGDFHLAKGSPAIGAGFHGIDLGAVPYP